MESSVFDARVLDTARLCYQSGVPRFLGFLSPAEAALAVKALAGENVSYCFFGGFDGAERTMLGCLPDWCENPEFPITAVTFCFRKQDFVSHRDVLGTLMGLGIVREAVGDILVEPGRAVAFVKNDIAEFVVSQTEKIGRVGVSAAKGFSEPLPAAGELTVCRETVASLRLDCVVSALCKISRTKAAELISDGMVSVNSISVSKAVYSISSGDRVTVRSKGRFTVISADGVSRKGRIILEYGKFI